VTLAERLHLAERIGHIRQDWRMVEYLADALLDDELDLRIDAARLAIQDAHARVEELILDGGGDPELDEALA